MSAPPSRPAAAASASIACGSETSASTASASPPPATIASTVARSASGCRPAASTRAPRSASSAAVAAPMPLAAPVTIAVLPAKDTRRMLGLERLRDRRDVAVIGPAAAADQLELRQLGAKLRVECAQLDRIAGVEGRRLIELGMALAGGVGAHAADAVRPVAVEDIREVLGVRAVDHEGVGRRLGVSLLDRAAQRLAARQPPRRLQRAR